MYSLAEFSYGDSSPAVATSPIWFRTFVWRKCELQSHSLRFRSQSFYDERIPMKGRNRSQPFRRDFDGNDDNDGNDDCFLTLLTAMNSMTMMSTMTTMSTMPSIAATSINNAFVHHIIAERVQLVP